MCTYTFNFYYFARSITLISLLTCVNFLPFLWEKSMFSSSVYLIGISMFLRNLRKQLIFNKQLRFNSVTTTLCFFILYHLSRNMNKIYSFVFSKYTLENRICIWSGDLVQRKVAGGKWWQWQVGRKTNCSIDNSKKI